MNAPVQLDLFRPAENFPTAGSFEQPPPAAECEKLTMSNLHSEIPDNADQMPLLDPAARVAELAGKFEEDDVAELANLWPSTQENH
jgi:hypothetical protein